MTNFNVPGIYCILNTKNGKKYTGQAFDVLSRLKEVI